jgi:hypothetical protein
LINNSFVKDLLNTALTDDNPFTASAEAEGGTSTGRLDEPTTLIDRSYGKRGMLLSLYVMNSGEPNLSCRAPIRCVGKVCVGSLCSTAAHKAAPKSTFDKEIIVVGIDSSKKSGL